MFDNNLITILILARNEEIHIRRCIESAKKLTSNIIVVDSNSTDRTSGIALECGAEVLNVDCDSFSEKINWCLNSVSYKTEWVFRVDADEVLTDKLVQRLEGALSVLQPNITGIYINRHLSFMGSRLRFGGFSSNYSIRIWRPGKVRCEKRVLDEHLILESGKSVRVELSIVDDPLTDLSLWIDKHNTYSTLEAQSGFEKSQSEDIVKSNILGDRTQRKRWIRANIYDKLPQFVGPFLYFLYRYVFLFGFLDGMPGFLFHFYHTFWYRMLVDTKIRELKKRKH